jgi:transcriptional regulator with XRE-family HTH domain/anti-sigma regulatory factor (Ser/Thr protein kinase)
VGDVVALGARLRQRREELGLTQTQAARQLDVARTAYRLWELEAARPAPDRWRTIATWLGISMTAMLLAEELIDEQEAANAQRLAASGGMTPTQWDEESSTSAGDNFSQERSMIDDQTRAGHLSARDAADLRRVLARVQTTSARETAPPWHPGEFRKRFPNDVLAPALARAALATTAIGIPRDAFEDAELITSEIVTNSVKHSGSGWVEVAIVVGSERVRVEVSDQSPRSLQPRTPDVAAGWGLAIIGALANRWGVEREPARKTIWFECDLRTPAAPERRG